MEDKEEATVVSAVPTNMCVPGSEAIVPAPTSAIVVVVAKDDQVVESDQDHLQLIPAADHHPDQQEVPVQIINSMPNNNSNKKKSYGPYQCPRCSLICNTSQAFAGHMRGHHKSTRLGLYKPVFKPPPKKPSSNNSNKVMPPPPLLVKTLSSQPPAALPTPTLPVSSSPIIPSPVILPTTTTTATGMTKAMGMATTIANCSPLPRHPSQSLMSYLFGDNIEPHKTTIPVNDYGPSIGAAVATATAGAGVEARGGANNINRIMNLKTLVATLLKQRRALAFLHACNIEVAARLALIEQEMTKAIAMASSSISYNAPKNHELVFQPNLPMPAMVKQQVDYHDHHRQQHLGLDLSDDGQRRAHLEFTEKINGEKEINIMDITPADGHGEEELDLSLRL